MANIVIKKKVDLGFLGDDYKESYLVFKSIPIKDYDKIIEEVEKFKDDNKQALTYIRGVVPTYFLEGKFQGEDVVKEDLDDFDQETYLQIFQRITGQRQAENLGEV